MKKRVSAELFVRTYIKEDSLENVAKELHITPEYVVNRAYRLRKEGVRIPKPTQKMPHTSRNRKSRVLALNAVVRELQHAS